MLDLHRPLERGLLKEGSEKDVEAVRELLKHLLRLVGVSANGKIDAANVRAVVGVPAASLRTNKQYLRNAMKGIVDSLLIVTEPFAVAYGLDALLHTMIIDIGAGTTDFCVMKGRYPTRRRPAHADHRRRLDRHAAPQADRGALPAGERDRLHGPRVEGKAQLRRRRTRRRSSSPRR